MNFIIWFWHSILICSGWLLILLSRSSILKNIMSLLITRDYIINICSWILVFLLKSIHWCNLMLLVNLLIINKLCMSVFPISYIPTIVMLSIHLIVQILKLIMMVRIFLNFWVILLWMFEFDCCRGYCIVLYILLIVRMFTLHFFYENLF